MEPPDDHNCQEVLNRVHLCLDGEMTPSEERAFLEEIRSCSCCLEKYNIEKNFKEFLTSKIERKTVNAELVETIRGQVAQLA
jgi:anti-sigma factor (TIGR02949 family)